MAGTAIGQHPAPQALERTAATEQQARAFAPALDQKRQKCLMQDALAGMGLDAIDGAKRLAGRSIDRHDLGARTALIPAGAQDARGGGLKRKLALAHCNLCRVHTHGISCRPRCT